MEAAGDRHITPENRHPSEGTEPKGHRHQPLQEEGRTTGMTAEDRVDLGDLPVETTNIEFPDMPEASAYRAYRQLVYQICNREEVITSP